MRIKVGAKLHEVREQRKMTQAEFAELLSMSQSAYSRLERDEIQTDFENLIRYAEVLKMPLNDFLPDSIIFNNHQNQGNGPVGSVMGDYIYNNYPEKEEAIKNLTHENERLKDKLAFLEEKIALLERLVNKEGGA